MMRQSKTVYFNEQGNVNTEKVIDLVIKTAKKNNINQVVMFAGRMKSISLFLEKAKDSEIELIVATYANGRTFSVIDKETDEEHLIESEVSTKEIRSELEKMGVKYVQGLEPLQPILSYTGDNSMEMIVSTLKMISNSLPLCVNAAIMAYENGFVDGKIIAFSGDTAIITTPTFKKDLFDFKIHEILCKPE